MLTTALVGVAGVVCVITIALLLQATTASTKSAAKACDLIAAPDGSDDATGTREDPLLSVQRLVDSLVQGGTGCLRGGTYAADQQVEIATRGITLTSYAGERAEVVARLWVQPDGDDVTISDLTLDGSNPSNLPSPTITADDVTLRRNDITNGHTTICLVIGNPTYGRARRTLIEGNRIHACGELPATNKDHGIYVNSADDTVIRGNLVYDNADRGVQLYPDAQGTLVTDNLIYGNGEGVSFGGDERTSSSNNLVEGNVIANSIIRDNVDAFWGGEIGSGNVVRGNCVAGGPNDDGDGGIIGDSGARGFTAVDNVTRGLDLTKWVFGGFDMPLVNLCSR